MSYAEAGTSLSPLGLEGQIWQSWLAERSSFAFQRRDQNLPVRFPSQAQPSRSGGF